MAKSAALSEEVRPKHPPKKDKVSDQNGGDSQVDIPSPSPPSGFQRGLEPECIMGATEMEGQILFLVKWLVGAVGVAFATCPGLI